MARHIRARHPPSMFRLCSTNSSWLQGLWKKADSHDSFQILQAQTAIRMGSVLIVLNLGDQKLSQAKPTYSALRGGSHYVSGSHRSRQSELPRPAILPLGLPLACWLRGAA
jgi:hypothetical protein